jgi:hypothetical protein
MYAAVVGDYQVPVMLHVVKYFGTSADGWRIGFAHRRPPALVGTFGAVRGETWQATEPRYTPYGHSGGERSPGPAL